MNFFFASYRPQIPFTKDNAKLWLWVLTFYYLLVTLDGGYGFASCFWV